MIWWKQKSVLKRYRLKTNRIAHLVKNVFKYSAISGFALSVLLLFALHWRGTITYEYLDDNNVYKKHMIILENHPPPLYRRFYSFCICSHLVARLLHRCEQWLKIKLNYINHLLQFRWPLLTTCRSYGPYKMDKTRVPAQWAQPQIMSFTYEFQK